MNPYDRFTPDQRRQKIVRIYANIYLRMEEKEENKKSGRVGCAGKRCVAPSA
jgi:hypothetical protein